MAYINGKPILFAPVVNITENAGGGGSSIVGKNIQLQVSLGQSSGALSAYDSIKAIVNLNEVYQLKELLTALSIYMGYGNTIYLDNVASIQFVCESDLTTTINFNENGAMNIKNGERTPIYDINNSDGVVSSTTYTLYVNG